MTERVTADDGRPVVAGTLRGTVLVWRRLRPLVGESWSRVVILAGASAFTGVLEATLLGLIAAVAVSLSVGDGAAGLSLLSTSLRVGIGTLLVVGALLACARLLLQLLVAWLPARIAADVQARLRCEIFEAYIRADWPVQAAEREGHLLGTCPARPLDWVERRWSMHFRQES